MAEEIRERAEDLTNVPDPALHSRRRIKADIAFVLQEQNIEIGRRLWIKFRNINGRFITGRDRDDTKSDIYQKKVALYVSQQGKIAIMWMDDSFWKVERRKKLKRSEYRIPLTMKIDVSPIDIEESRASSIKKFISESSVL